MNTLGSHPGAILFRFSVMMIIILIMIVVFFRYIDESRKGFEAASILRTKQVIDSSLTVVFAKAAIKRQLNELAQVDGGNPFEYMQRYEIAHPAYLGELNRDLLVDDTPGWYYLSHRGKVVYKVRYLERDHYYQVVLNFDDLNQTGRYESNGDLFRGLRFVKIAEL